MAREYSPEELEQMGAKDAPEFSEADLEQMERAGKRRGYAEPKSFRQSDVDLGIEGPVERFERSTPDQWFAPGRTTDPATAGRNFVPAVPKPRQTELEGDPLAQTVVTSAVLGPLGTAAANMLRPAIGVAATPAVAAGEGAISSKMTGGSAGSGALTGGALGLLGAGARGLSPSAAAARQSARTTKDITKGVTKASAGAKDDVLYAAGEGGGNLARVERELPGTGRALQTKAKTNPAGAAEETVKALSDLTQQNDATYQAIQQYHGGVPVKSLVDRMYNLWGRLTNSKQGVAADAVKRYHDDLLERYGTSEKFTAQDLRNVRNDIRGIIDPTRTIDPNTKRQAHAAIADELNGVIEDLASTTPGVDVAALKMRNNQISTLIPVQEALEERVAGLADREARLLTRAKEAPRNMARRAAREFDSRMSRLAPEPVMGPVRPEAPSNFDPLFYGGVPLMTGAARHFMGERK